MIYCTFFSQLVPLFEAKKEKKKRLSFSETLVVFT